MMRKYLIWFLVGPIIVALGIWGWKYMRQRSLDQKNVLASQNQNLPYLPPEGGEKLDQSVVNRQILEQAVKSFRMAKSFRASISQPTEQGNVTGELEYVKPLRLHAVLTPPDKQILEMTIIGATVYYRTGKETWEMTNNAFAKSFGQAFFTSMLASDDTLASFGVEADAQITVQTDAAKKCKNYKTKYKQDDKYFEIQFCLNGDNQIASMTTETKEGKIVADYKDYNALFLIERPRMPLLEPRKPGEVLETSSTTGR